jgi:glycosyltransferase involved in cell wall biosynthesis
MDEVWVPTQFHYETFRQSGVDARKLFVVPEAVDTDFFDPSKYEPIQLPLGRSLNELLVVQANLSLNALPVRRWVATTTTTT